MKTESNTIALAYTNDKGEIVAWSADSFGSPREYPKTYKDIEENREMLKKKGVDKKRKFGKFVADFLAPYNPIAEAIFRESMSGDEKIFNDLKIEKAVIVKLDLVTNYDKDNYSPTWEQVESCINNKEYETVND